MIAAVRSITGPSKPESSGCMSFGVGNRPGFDRVGDEGFPAMQKAQRNYERAYVF